MPETQGYATSKVLNYSGMLFNKGNTRTPLSSIIGSKAKITNHIEFEVGQSYTTEGADKDFHAVTEASSLKTPPLSYIKREQERNITQIFHEAVGISYVKQSNMGTLSGLNVANQQANPISELDFQVAAKIQKINRDIEYTFINSVFKKDDDEEQEGASKKPVGHSTRGLINAIDTNKKNMDGKPLGLWDIADLVKRIYESQSPTEGLCLWCNATTMFQINADAAQNGLTVVPAAREINGISLSSVITPLGVVYIYLGECLPPDTALLLNLDVIAPVYQPVPGKGNFFLEQLAKTGAGERYQLFGQIGLDHGPEWYHGKITGISKEFKTPTYSRSVHVSNAKELTNLSVEKVDNFINMFNTFKDDAIVKVSEIMDELSSSICTVLNDADSQKDTTELTKKQGEFKTLLNSKISEIKNSFVISSILFYIIKVLDNNKLTKEQRTSFYHTMINICDDNNKEILKFALKKLLDNKNTSN